MVFCDLFSRKASVDENYEWDAVDFCSQPRDRDGEYFSFLINNMQFTYFGTNTGEKRDTFVCLESLINTVQC